MVALLACSSGTGALCIHVPAVHCQAGVGWMQQRRRLMTARGSGVGQPLHEGAEGAGAVVFGL